jgi:ketosteroid isomerase-like protein/predicted enzyme related to lactoylglutathione lyase
MSFEDLEMMRAAMEAFNQRDSEGFGAAFADDAEIVPVRAALEGTVFRGEDAAAQYCAAIEQSWEHLRWDVEDFRHGDDWVLAVGHIRGSGRGSGVAIDARAGWVARFRSGLIVNFHTYADRDAALDAVGLRRVGMDSALALIEFPADDTERALGFWSGLLGLTLEPRAPGEGDGWQTRTAGRPGIGVHARGQGPGDSFSLPYFEVEDLPAALVKVQALGGSVVHPGERWAICKDSEGSPFGLASTGHTVDAEG